MNLFLRKWLGIMIVSMFLTTAFAGIIFDVGAKKSDSENKEKKNSDNDYESIAAAASILENLGTLEAVINFDLDAKQIMVSGYDETDDDVDVTVKLIKESKKDRTLEYTLTNDAGETLELTVKTKTSDKNKYGAELEVLVIEYGWGDPIKFKSNSVLFQTNLKEDRRAGDLNKLKQVIKVKNQFDLMLDYKADKELTTINYNEHGGNRVDYDVGGLVLCSLKTDNGGFTLSLLVDGVEESIEDIRDAQIRLVPSQLLAYDELIGNSDVMPTVRFGDYSGVPEYISGCWEPDPRLRTAGEIAVDFVETYGDLFRLDPNSDSFSVSDISRGTLGLVNVKLQQKYGNIPVFGSELIVHLDRMYNVQFVNGYFASGINIDTKARISAELAATAAKSDLMSKFPRVRIGSIGTPELNVYNSAVLNRFCEGENVLVWFIMIKTTDPMGEWYYFVNAENGDIVEAWDNYGGASSDSPWSHLLYLRQSGAISEAYNIIISETDDVRTSFTDPIWRGERDHMDSYLHIDGRCNLSNDNCGVTENSAIITKLFLLLAYGGTHYGTYTSGIGISKTTKLLLYTLTESGISCSASISEFRDVMCKTSDDILFGSSGTAKDDKRKVKIIWTAIGFPMIKQTIVANTIGENDKFGWALAKGDFNNDSYEDLAIGAPYDDKSKINDGTVSIFYGSIIGLKVSGTEHLTQALAGNTHKDYDKFGWSLASGDYNGDGFDDLAIGMPYKNLGGKSNSGQVIIFYGSEEGLISDPPDDDSDYIVSTLTERLSQSHAGETLSNGDKFGWALASGNFDNDSYDDLAVGMPHENYEKVNDGIVIVFYGSDKGLLPDGPFIAPVDKSEIITQEDAGLDNRGGDNFGHALAVGNFNNDTFDDIAIGIPYKKVNDVIEAGLVVVLHGTEDGLLPVSDAEILHQEMTSLENEDYDRFGYSLAAGDFDNDSIDDLAVGIPYKNYEEVNDGVVIMFYGMDEIGFHFIFGIGKSVLIPPITNIFQQEKSYETNEYNDQFGKSLCMSDLDGDSYDDLVVGVPSENKYWKTNNGVIDVFYGKKRPGAIAFTFYWRTYVLSQRYFGGLQEDEDRFGQALASGDFNGDGVNEIAVSAPYKDAEPFIKNIGVVYVRTLEPALPWVNATSAILYSRSENRVIGIKDPDWALPMASTTKIMTALITIERINLPDTNPDHLDLDMVLEISLEAGQMEGSIMGLDSGDEVDLNNTLYGLLLPSGNDAAVAIAEEIAGDGEGGKHGAFSDLMDIRAAELGLTNSFYENPWGGDTTGHYQSARDLALLADFTLNEPLFAKIVGTDKHFTQTWENFLGFNKNQWLYNTNRFIKSWWTDYYWSDVYGVKTGTTTYAGQCLVTAADDGSEDLISVVLFSAPYGDEGPPNRYTDSRTILEHGFEYDYPFN